MGWVATRIPDKLVTSDTNRHSCPELETCIILIPWLSLCDVHLGTFAGQLLKVLFLLPPVRPLPSLLLSHKISSQRAASLGFLGIWHSYCPKRSHSRPHGGRKEETTHPVEKVQTKRARESWCIQDVYTPMRLETARQVETLRGRGMARWSWRKSDGWERGNGRSARERERWRVDREQHQLIDTFSYTTHYLPSKQQWLINTRTNQK